MGFFDVLRQTFSTLREHKLRSFLTMFGITWGIASVILLVGLGKGFSKDQKDRMKTLGTDLVILFGGRTSAQAGGYAAGRDIRLSIDDVYLIQRECNLIKSISPELRRTVPEVSRYNSASRPVRGIWPDYQRFRSLRIGSGRLLSDEDEKDSRRVAVLGVDAAIQLFGPRPAVGETLAIKGRPYEVIGVLAKKKQNGNYGSGPDNTQIFVPYSSMARDFPPPDRPGITRGWVNNIVFEVANPDEHEEAIKQMQRTLARAHHFDPEDKDALFMWNTLEGSKLVQRIFDVMTLFFGAVAVITLCLGGIGVMNIMLVSVTERTREIGVRKAMGATRANIASQFFAEAAIITAFSGMFGLGIGVGVCLLLGVVPKPDFLPAPVVSTASLVVSVVTLSAITMTAGMYPAQRAGLMTPVECLRSE